ncbi:hypothetical protein GCM10028824_15830 [Hymenobacter segetis]
MLNQLITLNRWVLHLINRLNSWEAESQRKSRSSIASERLCYVLKCLRSILRLSSEIMDGISANEAEAKQQQPSFWLGAETSTRFLYQQDSELDGVWILVQKDRAIGKANPNYGRIADMVPMKDLVL